MEPCNGITERTGALEKHGNVWKLEYAGIEARLEDLIGLHYLAILLAHPGEHIPAIELVPSCASRRSGSRRAAPRSEKRHVLSIEERARFRVSHAIRTALRRIAQCHTSLALHLRATICMGRFLSYDPGTGIRVVWRISDATPSGNP